MLPALMTDRLGSTGRFAVDMLAPFVGRRAPDPDPDLPRGHGPVLLLGGAATTASLLRPMAGWLTGLGYDVTPVAIGAGLGCAQRTVDALGQQVDDACEASGTAVRLVGHSRGGQFARAVAGRVPGRVSGLVTLGTPFDVFGLRLPMMLAATALATAGTLGLPGVARLSCLAGACCREFRSGLRRPWPEDLPFTSIYSRADRVVPACASFDPAARNVEVTCGHAGLLTDREAHHAVAHALAGGRAADVGTREYAAGG